MQRRVKKYLYDVWQACLSIQRFVEGKSLDDYRNSDLLCSAVERKFEIIGEAINRILHQDPSLESQLTNARAIVRFRNRLIHGYDMVDETVVWDIIECDLPMLISEVQGFLASGE